MADIFVSYSDRFLKYIFNKYIETLERCLIFLLL